jgi:biotin operon repressor
VKRPKRKTRMTALAVAIRDLADEGMTSREIGKALGKSKTAVAKCARWHGVRLQTSKSRAYRVALPWENAEIIIKLSGESGLAETEIVARIVAIVVGDGMDRARKRLGKALAKDTV